MQNHAPRWHFGCKIKCLLEVVTQPWARRGKGAKQSGPFYPAPWLQDTRLKRRFYDSSRRESCNSCLVSDSFMCSPCGGSGPVSHIGPCYFRAKKDVMSAWGRHNTASVTTAEWFREQMHQQGAPCEDDEQKWNSSRCVVAVAAKQRCHAMGGLNRAGCFSWAGQCQFLHSSAFPLNTDKKKFKKSLKKTASGR